MTFPFNREGGIIVVQALILGIAADTVARLALHTGASKSLLNRGLVVNLGYDLELPDRQARVVTASGIENVPQISLRKIEALGTEQSGFPVLCHNLPRGAGVDGLLGLDFFRGQRLTIDFREGLITLD